MPLSEYFFNNLPMLFELIGLLIILFISVHVSKRIKTYTRLAVFLLLTSILITAFENWTQTFEHLSLWRPILTAFKYSTYPLILIDLILLAFQNIKPISVKWKIIACIPEAICVPIFFSSQWTRLVFYFSEDNHYGGGPLNMLPYILFGIYLVLFVVLNIIYLMNYSIRNRIIALYITLASALIVVVYLIINKTDDYNPIFTSALVFYFLFIYIHMASIDPLTGLRNRQSYYQDISESGQKITYVASVDMNDLKELNDTYGHANGDEALTVVADTLSANVGKKARCYRVGGDEFMILFVNENKQETAEQLDRIKTAMNSCKYQCAFGYAEKKSFMSVDDAIKESDRQMYLNKAELKSKKQTPKS